LLQFESLWHADSCAQQHPDRCRFFQPQLSQVTTNDLGDGGDDEQGKRGQNLHEIPLAIYREIRNVLLESQQMKSSTFYMKVQSDITAHYSN